MNNPLVIILLLGLSCSCLAGEKDWDELTFTQEWGYTACRQFKDRSPGSEKSCRFEGQPSIWSVHGIWPTKEGTEGPSFCKKVKFNVDALTPIMKDLNQYWYEIDQSKDAHQFWQHEWTKHGSCAMELDIFDTELKYFGEGIALRNKLDVYTILKAGGGIVPSATQGYKLQDIHKAFQQSLGSDTVVPYLQCLSTRNQDTQATEYHMLAIEICLNKDLQLLDCHRSKKRQERSVSEMYGDQAEPCPQDEPILYTDYAFQRNSQAQAKKFHKKKPFFAKKYPISAKFWKKFEKRFSKSRYLL